MWIPWCSSSVSVTAADRADMKRILTISLLLAAVCDPAAAQVAAAHIGADSISVGELTELVLGVAHDGVRRAVFPDETGEETPPEAIGTVGDFELLSRVSAGSRVLPGGDRLDSVVYRATTFALDTAWVAPVVRLATESDTIQVAGMPRVVPVRSVVPDDAADILDITPIAEFPRAWWPWILVLALLAAGWLLAWWLRKRAPDEEPEPEPEPEPAEPPLDEALRRLAALAEADVSSDRAMKPFFVELSDILRTYVARKTGVPALELTTGELIDELSRIRDAVHLSDERVHDVDRLLRTADMVKFADIHPPPENARLALQQTATTVRVTEKALTVEEPLDSGGMP